MFVHFKHKKVCKDILPIFNFRSEFKSWCSSCTLQVPLVLGKDNS